MIKTILDQKAEDLQVRAENEFRAVVEREVSSYECEETSFAGEGNLLLKDLGKAMTLASEIRKWPFW